MTDTPPARPPTCANCGHYEHQHQRLNNGTNDRRY